MFIIHNGNELEINNRDNRKASKHLETKQHTFESSMGQRRLMGNLKKQINNNKKLKYM